MYFHPLYLKQEWKFYVIIVVDTKQGGSFKVIIWVGGGMPSQMYSCKMT